MLCFIQTLYQRSFQHAVKMCVRMVKLRYSPAHLLYLSANHVKYYYNKLQLSPLMQDETNHSMTMSLVAEISLKEYLKG